MQPLKPLLLWGRVCRLCGSAVPGHVVAWTRGAVGSGAVRPGCWLEVSVEAVSTSKSFPPRTFLSASSLSRALWLPARACSRGWEEPRGTESTGQQVQGLVDPSTAKPKRREREREAFLTVSPKVSLPP